MKFKAKDLLAQLNLSQLPSRVKIEEVDSSELSTLDLYEHRQPNCCKLQHLFDAQNQPRRMRIIDSDGQMYDIMLLQNGKIGVEKLDVVIVYNTPSEFYTWEEAEESLANDWDLYSPITASKK